MADLTTEETWLLTRDTIRHLEKALADFDQKLATTTLNRAQRRAKGLTQAERNKRLAQINVGKGHLATLRAELELAEAAAAQPEGQNT